MRDAVNGRRYRCALITGAAGGLGVELCRLLAAEGTELLLIDHQAEALAKIAAELSGQVAVRSYAVDLRDHAKLAALVPELLREAPLLDLVVMNAGIDRPGRLEDGDWQTIRDHFSVNVVSHAVLLSLLSPRLLKNAPTHVVAVASLAALMGFPYEAAYCASKAGLAMFIEAARAELAPRGVAFTTVFPGYIATPMVRGNAFKVDTQMTASDAARRILVAMKARQFHAAFPVLRRWMLWVGHFLPLWIRDRIARRTMDPARLALGAGSQKGA